jgi:hypothetical protein
MDAFILKYLYLVTEELSQNRISVISNATWRSEKSLQRTQVASQDFSPSLEVATLRVRNGSPGEWF